MADIVDRYLELGLRLGRLLDGLVDAYYGPVAVKERVDNEPAPVPARLAADARALLAECRRVLREEGLLYLSTPNRTVTRWMPPNPFHVREFTAAELVALVRGYFGTVACFGQRPVFLPVFVLRQMARRWLASLPGVWRLWSRMRPRRTQLAATAWQGSHFDRSLLDERYGVRPARGQPMYTVLVARC